MLLAEPRQQPCADLATGFDPSRLSKIVLQVKLQRSKKFFNEVNCGSKPKRHLRGSCNFTTFEDAYYLKIVIKLVFDAIRVSEM